MSLLLNICRYNNCGIVFPNLNQLIQHIESEHINFNAEYVEKLEAAKPAALPLSYILPSNIELTENAESDEERERPSSSALTDSEQQSLALVPLSDDVSNISESADATFEDEVDPDDTFTFDFIMRYGSKRTENQFEEKPFICPMPDCPKRYKNVNGLRYHARNGHKKNIKPAKKFECYCGRGYKTSQGLRAHAMALHNIALILPSSSSLPQSEDALSLLTLANMPNNTFEHIHGLDDGANMFESSNELASIEGLAAGLDLSGALTDETILNMSFGIKNERGEPNSNSESAKVDHVNNVFDNTNHIKTEEDENSSTSSSFLQETSDVDEKITQTHAGSVKIETKDDDEIDVGDAKDNAYPYYF